MLNQISDLVFAPFKNVGLKLIDKIPELIGALILLILGAIVGKLLRKLTEKVLVIAKLDTVSEKIGISEVTHRIGIGRSPAVIIGFLVYWFVFLTFLVSAAEVLKFAIVSELLNQFILFIPRLIAAIFVLAVGVIVGNFLNDIVIKAANANNIKTGMTLGRITKVLIIIFVSIIALEQLQIGTLIVSDTFKIILMSIGIAAAIAFGLGGKSIAEDFLRSFLKRKD